MIGSLIQQDETNTLLALKFLRRFQLQGKLQELLEQGGIEMEHAKAGEHQPAGGGGGLGSSLDDLAAANFGKPPIWWRCWLARCL